MKVKKLVRKYLEHVHENLSPSTHRTYAGRIKSFVEKFGDRKFEKLKPEDFQGWIKEAAKKKNGEPQSQDTRRLNSMTLKRVQQFAIELGVIDSPILEDIPTPPGRKRQRIPSRDEQAQIIRAGLKGGYRRFVLAFRSLRLCGARPGELCAATISDFDPDINVITLGVHKTAESTGTIRAIGVGQKMRRILERSIGDRESGPIFLDKKGNPWTPDKLSRIYKRLVRRCGLSEKLVLYCTRHEHGTAVCRKHGIQAAAHSLGHRSIQTTQRYVHPDDRWLSGYQDAM